MPINNHEILQLLAELSVQENLRTTISQSAKGGVITGALAMLGGILLGPLGLVAGGAIGGLTAASTCKSFRPLAEVLLHDLTPAQQANLVNRVRNIISDVDASDFVTLSAILLSRENVRNSVLAVLKAYIRNELRLSFQ